MAGDAPWIRPRQSLIHGSISRGIGDDRLWSERLLASAISCAAPSFMLAQ